ncbi:MAG: DedA family protein [Omnitrophica WOR_2 bacterium]
MDITHISSLINTLFYSFEKLANGGMLPRLGIWDYLLLIMLSLIQGPVAPVIGGAAAASGIVRPEGVFLTLSTSNLSIDMFWYAVGRQGKLDWLSRFNWFSNVSRNRIDKLRTMVFDQSSTVVTLAKFTSGFVMPTMVATGLVRVPWKRWLPSLFIIELFRTGLLVGAGFYFSTALGQLLKGYSYLTFLFTILVIIMSAWLVSRTLRLDAKVEG